MLVARLHFARDILIQQRPQTVPTVPPAEASRPWSPLQAAASSVTEGGVSGPLTRPTHRRPPSSWLVSMPQPKRSQLSTYPRGLCRGGGGLPRPSPGTSAMPYTSAPAGLSNSATGFATLGSAWQMAGSGLGDKRRYAVLTALRTAHRFAEL